MNKHVWTTADAIYLLTVASPLVILAAMFAAAAMTWQTEQTKLDRVIAQTIGQDNELDNAALARRYDDRTSQSQTDSWKSILAASEELNAKYGGPFAWSSESEAYDSVAAPGTDWPPQRILSAYARDASPILTQIETLLGSDETIWLPIVFESLQTNLNEAQQSRGVARMLHYSFASAIYEQRNDQALMILRAADRLFGSKYEPILLIDELVRMACYNSVQSRLRQSLGLDVWSPEELTQLESIVAKPFDWDSRWKAMVESEMLYALPMLVDGDAYSSAAIFGPRGLIILAPSVLRSTVELQQSMASIQGTGSKAHMDLSEFEGSRWLNATSEIRIDRWLQVPSMSGDWLISMVTPAYDAAAAAYVREANNHRWTRTILALRMFRKEFGQWPESLSELSRVGLPSSTILAFDGGPFDYAVDGSDRATIINQADPATTWSFMGEQPDSLTMLP